MIQELGAGQSSETLWSLLSNIFDTFLWLELFQDAANLAVGGMVLAREAATSAPRSVARVSSTRAARSPMAGAWTFTRRICRTAQLWPGRARLTGGKEPLLWGRISLRLALQQKKIYYFQILKGFFWKFARKLYDTFSFRVRVYILLIISAALFRRPAKSGKQTKLAGGAKMLGPASP